MRQQAKTFDRAALLWQSEGGAVLAWMTIFLPALLALAVLAAEVLNWQALAHELQTAADAAALAGAQEVFVRQEVDSFGQVWSEQVYLNEQAAQQQASAVLDANLQRVMDRGLLTVTDREIAVDSDTLEVRVAVTGQVRVLLADRFGIRPSVIRRQAAASPVVE